MNIALIGRTEIMYDLIDILIKEGHSIAFISTSKEAPEYLKKASDFQSKARQLNIPFLYAPKITTEDNVKFIKALGNIDIAISVNHTSIIGRSIIDLFPLGILNIHGGDLPRYRGNACQAWAILNAETRIGLCVHKMEADSLDSGDIIVREYMSIDINTKVTHCWEWIKKRAPYMFLKAIELLSVNPKFVLEKQALDPQKILRCYPRNPEDNRIDWINSSEYILRLINASNKPYSGAFCFFRGRKAIVWDAELFDDQENYLAVPGQICSFDATGIVVICGIGKLKLKEVEVDGVNIVQQPILNYIRERFK